MMFRDLVLENPVLVKHVRSRLRLQHLIPLIVIVIALCICISWAGIVSGRDRSAVTSITVLQALILFLVGAAAVATAVSNARESGMLDFHRISPQQPAAITLGFLLGAPIREYVLFACTLPFSLLLAVGAGYSILGWLAVLTDLIVVSLLYYTIAILAGLALPRRTSSMMVVVLIVVVLNLGWVLQIAGCLTIVPTVLSVFSDPKGPVPISTTILGYPVSAFLVSLLHQVPVLVFLLLAAARKMRHELAYPLSKADAVMFYLVVALLLVADARSGRLDIPAGLHDSSAELGIPTLMYGLLTFGALLAALVTPNAGALARGIRHARKLGFSRVSSWGDHAANLTAVAVLALVFVGAGAAASALSRYTPWSMPGTSVVALIGACAVLFWGLAKQSFDLAFRRNSTSYLMLLMFVCWVLPLILGLLISAVSSGRDTMASHVLALSPLSSMGLLLTTWAEPTTTTNASIAIAASVGLVAVFAIIAWRVTCRAVAAEWTGRPVDIPAQ
ncbi:MAG: hypothetical protein ABSD48_15095 [Armatimonadota bacterium]|jgi:uncharacterized membrane protein YwzB